MDRGTILKGALAKTPSLQRMSPGVYRNAAEQLVNYQGTQLPNHGQQQQYPTQNLPANNFNPSMVGNAIAGFGRGVQQEQGPGMAQQIAAGMTPNPYGNAAMGIPTNGAAPQNMNFQDLVKYGQDQQNRNNMLQNLPLPNWANRPQNWNPDPRFAAQHNPMFTPNMPHPSANYNGQYRLSPGIYGTRDQAMNQYNQQLQQMQAQNAAMPMMRKG